LKNNEKAFFLMEGSKGLYIITKDNKNYILGIQDFEILKQVFEKEISPISESKIKNDFNH